MRRLLRDLHHQTWELELLISGTVAIVLALLPTRVDQFYFAASAQTSGLIEEFGFLTFYFIKLTLYTLVLAFAFHIMVRAFWVALVGLDSVFPRGPVWSRLRLGPVSEGVFRRVLPSVRELILATDAIASVTFATAFTLVATFALFVPWAAVLGGVILGLGHLLGFNLDLGITIAATTAGVVLLLAVPLLVDRLFGRRIVEGGGGRLVERLLLAATAITGLRVFGSVQYTLASHVGRRWFSVGTGAFVIAVVTFFVVNDAILRSGAFGVGVDAWDPERAGAVEVDPQLYETAFDPRMRRPLVPTIPSAVIDAETPYVRLFMPFLPEVDPPALARVCPDVTPSGRGGPRLVPRRSRTPSPDDADAAARMVACRAALWEVTLDGTRVEVDPVIFTRDDAGLRGLAWFIDVRPLLPGRHLLDIRRAAAALDPEASPDEDDLPRAYRIPFWN
ncbi:MAG: hypothetical protein RQ745_08360 [Longimicrobiales bacterium]|nr:hypothetical protein [Longimicrobiales bacterium]